MMAEQELRDIDTAYRNYLLTKKGSSREPPATFLNGLLSDDYFSIEGDGKIGDKAQRIAVVRDPESTTEFNRSTDVQVRVYGDKAVVYSFFEFKGTDKGQKISGRSRDIH